MSRKLDPMSDCSSSHTIHEAYRSLGLSKTNLCELDLPEEVNRNVSRYQKTHEFGLGHVSVRINTEAWSQLVNVV